MLPNQKLPCELLLMLFSYLSVPDDLVIVQQVCSAWRAVALDKSFWKNYTLTLKGTNEDKKKLHTMPGIRNINGEANNGFIYLILENINELCKLNVNFDPPLSFSQFKAVLKKYPKLESISFSVGAPDIIICLEILETSNHLMELDFHIHHSECVYSTHPVIEQIFHLLTDRNNFPALTKTNLVNPPLGFNDHNSGALIPAVADFISKRSDQLLSLNMETSSLLNLRETVSKCENLQELDLEVYGNDPSDIMIHNMTELKSLSLVFWRLGHGHDFHAIQEYFYSRSWAYLTKVCFVAYEGGERGILSAIIKNVKHLEDLHYIDGVNNTRECELCEVSKLHKLVELNVQGLQIISEIGMNYLSNCLKLKYLALEAHTSNINDIENYVRNTLHVLKNLDKLLIKCQDRRICIVLRDREKIEKFLLSSDYTQSLFL